ncbi:MAG: OmpW family protein [Rhodoplanes sp.]|nr:OmpW family protein [Rhodoplanes sp.]
MGEYMRLRTTAFWLATAAAAALSISSASAADLPAAYKAPVVVDTPWTGGWQVRARAVAVMPQDKVDLTVPALGALGALPNTGKVTTTVIPEIDISYYFTPNIALELILGVTPHKITGKGQLDGLQVGETWLLPPTLTLQYHFTNFGAFQPYIGAGVNYTFFFNTSAANTTTVVPLLPNGPAVAVTSLGLKNNWAPAVQVGFDYMLNKHVGLNFDVKYLWLSSDVTATLNNALAVTGKTNLDPLLIGGGVTYRF